MKISDLTVPVRPAEGRSEAAPAGRGGGAGAGWEAGRLLQGRVVSAGGDGRVVLELAGERVSARSSVPLTPGREFWFEVRQGGSEPHLALADKKGAMYRFLQQAAGGFGDLSRLGQLAPLLKAGGLATEPADLLGRLALGPEPGPEKIIQLASWLRAANLGPGGGSGVGAGGAVGAGGGGGVAPAALPEMLQNLLVALQRSQSAGGDREMLATLSRISGVLEAMVGVNEQPPAPNQAPLWLLPCFFAMDAGAGSWLLTREESGGEDQEEITTVAFFLEMSRLGELQLQARVQGEHLQGDFFLADAKAAAFMWGRLGELQQRLENLGYQVELRCRVSAAPLLPALKEAMERSVGGEARRLIDIRA